MTSCEQARLELGGYVLGGCTQEEAELVEGHVRGCERCAAELAELSELPELLELGASAPPPAPPDLRRRVLGLHRHPRVPVLLAAALVAVAALAGGLVVEFLQSAPEPDAELALEGAAPVGIVGEARLAQLESGVEVELELTGVRDADQGYYHAWLGTEDYRVSAGTFVGSNDGEVTARMLCGGSLDEYDRLLVTWHPAGERDEVVALDSELPA